MSTPNLDITSLGAREDAKAAYMDFLRVVLPRILPRSHLSGSVHENVEFITAANNRDLEFAHCMKRLGVSDEEIDEMIQQVKRGLKRRLRGSSFGG